MPEPALFPPRSNQTITLIESSPLNPASWEKLVERVRGQNDPLSIKSLEVIIEGLRKAQGVFQQAEKNKTPAPRLSVNSQAMFVRLAKAYNSPTLLKEIGLIYLRDLDLPETAVQHFERSLALGGPDKELRPLTEAAAVAVQRQTARRTGTDPSLSGITMSPHSQPAATNIIRQTGKMLTLSRGGLSAANGGAGPERDAAPPEPVPATTAECLAQAEEAVRNGNFKRATVLLKKADEKPGANADMWQAWTNLGQAYYQRSEYREVEPTFREAMKYAPEEMASHFNLALGYHLNGKYEAAVAAYSRANKIEARHPKVWCNLGVLYFALDSFEQAEAALRFALEIDPNYARAWDNLAGALGAQNKLEEALDACRHAIEIRPDYPEPHFKMGVIHFTNNILEKAVAEFHRAAVLPQLTAYSNVFLAMIQARMEKPEAGEAAAQLAAKADPKCDLLWMAWNDLGLAWYAEKNYRRAAAAYAAATALKPDEPETWLNLGVSQHRARDLKAARDSYQRAADLQGRLASAWHNLGTVCAEMGDLPAAMAAFQRETITAPFNARAWYDLGVTREKLGRMDEARAAFGKADALAGTTVMRSSPDGVIKKAPTVALPPGLEIKLP